MDYKKNLQDVGGFWNVSRKRRALQILVFCILACGVAAWTWRGQMQPARNGKVREVWAEGKKGKKENKKNTDKKDKNRKDKNKDKKDTDKKDINKKDKNKKDKNKKDKNKDKKNTDKKDINEKGKNKDKKNTDKKNKNKKDKSKKDKSKDKKNTDADKKDLGIKEERVDIRIPGLKNHYKFVFISDLHILVENKEVSAESLGEVRARRELFRTEKGMYSAKLWKKLPDFINSLGADAVLLGGDMVDYASTSNLKCLKRGIKKIKAPVVYVRADHDYEPFHCKGLGKKKMKRLHQSIDGYPGVSLLEFEDLCIVGINDSTKQISKKQLKEARKIFAKEKPVILLTHVPLNSHVDGSLEKASKEAWQGRALVWGKGCCYKPNRYTQKFLKLVYGKKSPVKAVLGGHLHFSWEGKLAKGILQHVFSPAYTGAMGIVTVDGK